MQRVNQFFNFLVNMECRTWRFWCHIQVKKYLCNFEIIINFGLSGFDLTDDFIWFGQKSVLTEYRCF